MFFTQKILRESGYRSEIYCVHVDERLSGSILPFTSYENKPDDLLLVHYSLGTEHDDWITNLKSHSLLIYHNITPAHFFPEGDGLRKLVESGRRQLAKWGVNQRFVGSIADSTFNAEELEGWGYQSIASIGLLVDLDRIRTHPWNCKATNGFAGARNIIFIGRLCPHKGQIDLVRMMEHLVRISDVPVRLLLAGGTTTEAYEALVRDEIAQRGLEANIQLLGKLSDEDIFALYRSADLYMSLSQHEGFGMPLVEAMAFDLPVLALSAGSVAATLGTGGLVLKNMDHERAAAAAKIILQEPWLRGRMITGQRRSLVRFERPVLVTALEQHLRRLGFEVTLDKAARTTPHGQELWSVEGPFDSSYSLAIVNRELARGLERAGERVALVSRDGPGPFAPNETFLRDQDGIAAMVARAPVGSSANVVLRNQYPPFVADMHGGIRVLANYAWEESGFRPDWADEFNVSLDLITVTSKYVAKVLRDNGVHTPICIVGNGVDHALPKDDGSLARPSGAPFRFLHVSSCFPRKGVDALLAAWARAFTNLDPVELVIKTFPNPHNSIERDLETFKTAYPNHAPIFLIDQDVDPSALQKLYASADAVVCPTKGEGFGLPLAEALVFGKPIITTSYGGQADFCNAETAWLCDYSFAYARTHLEIFDSVWVEPDVASLTTVLRTCYAAAPAERLRLATNGRNFVLKNFSWDQVAARTIAAVEQVRNLHSSALRLPKIGWVSTWNTRCGIAAYSKSLVCEIEPERLTVFAPKTLDLIASDETFVRRCWNAGWEDPLDELYDEIVAAGVDAVVIQFNFGFFRIAAFGQLIERLSDNNIIVFACLHATTDVNKPDITIRLRDIHESLAKLTRILVHSPYDLNHLKGIGLVGNVALFPMGLPEVFSGHRDEARERLNFKRKTVIASFGYLLPHKGLLQLIQAFALVRRRLPGAHLLMLNSLYPAAESEAERDVCLREIRKLGLHKDISLVTDFLPEAEVVSQLAAADVVVYPYQHTQESASAAVKLGIASLTPIACTPLPIFADIERVSHTLPGCSPELLAKGLCELLIDKNRLSALRDRQALWVAAHDWPILSRRLLGLIRGEFRDRQPRVG